MDRVTSPAERQIHEFIVRKMGEEYEHGKTDGRAEAGHGIDEPHNCSAMNCRGLGAEVRRLRDLLSAESMAGDQHAPSPNDTRPTGEPPKPSDVSVPSKSS